MLARRSPDRSGLCRECPTGAKCLVRKAASARGGIIMPKSVGIARRFAWSFFAIDMLVY